MIDQFEGKSDQSVGCHGRRWNDHFLGDGR